jgi:phosphoenolpyruvate carboxykinase (diphosphate)
VSHPWPELGLPHVSRATDRQKRDGMCWAKENELYNDGGAFKITFRTGEGVVLTFIVDNYFGYCKKEVKTQIGFAANLTGLSEEEHSGGALVFPSYNLGDFIRGNSDLVAVKGYTFQKAMNLLKGTVAVHPDGYAVDRRFPQVVYIPENADISLPDQTVSWTKGRKKVSILLSPDRVYVYPSGYKARMEKHPGAGTWRLIGTRATGTLCHKPCTVSGGGKSEISKSIPKVPSAPAMSRETSKPATFFMTCPPKLRTCSIPVRHFTPRIKSRTAPTYGRRGPDSPTATIPPKVAVTPKWGGSNASIWP